MNSNYTEFKFPQIRACQWRKVFRSKTPEDAVDFIAGTLAYDPERRVRPLEGCGHGFFDELRDARTRLPDGGALPPLFDFTRHERAAEPALLAKVGGGGLEYRACPLLCLSTDSPTLSSAQLIPPHVQVVEGEDREDSKLRAR